MAIGVIGGLFDMWPTGCWTPTRPRAADYETLIADLTACYRSVRAGL